jgi:hypothetical protein
MKRLTYGRREPKLPKWRNFTGTGVRLPLRGRRRFWGVAPFALTEPLSSPLGGLGDVLR